MSGDGFHTSRNRWSRCTWEREVDWSIFKVWLSPARGPQTAERIHAMRYLCCGGGGCAVTGLLAVKESPSDQLQIGDQYL